MSGADLSPTLVVFFLLAIFFSLAGGLLLGYFVGRTRNGQARDIDALEGQTRDLNERLDHLHAEIKRFDKHLFEPRVPDSSQGRETLPPGDDLTEVKSKSKDQP